MYPRLEEYRKLPFYPCKLYSHVWEGETYYAISIATGFTLDIDPIFERSGWIGDGAEWAEVVRQLIMERDPAWLKAFEFDCESSEFLVETTSESDQHRLAELIHRTARNESALDAIINRVKARDQKLE